MSFFFLLHALSQKSPPQELYISFIHIYILEELVHTNNLPDFLPLFFFSFAILQSVNWRHMMISSRLVNYLLYPIHQGCLGLSC